MLNEMLGSNYLRPQQKVRTWLAAISVPWTVTIVYLVLILLLPITALISKSLTIGAQEFWQIATSNVALSAYNVTFITAVFAALINGVMGTLVAWVLVRYSFPGRKIVDAAVDLPFALPTSVAGLALATVYNDKGWIGQFFAPFGIKIAFTRLGVFVAMLFISLPFIVRTLQPVLKEMEREIEEAAWSLGASPVQTFSRVILPPLFSPYFNRSGVGICQSRGGIWIGSHCFFEYSVLRLNCSRFSVSKIRTI